MRIHSVLFASLIAASTSLVACSDRAPQIIAVPSTANVGDVHEHPGAMSVTGTATLEVSPDCADLTMTLTFEASKPGAATAGVTSKEEALVAALDKIGIKAEDIKLSFVSMNPVYEAQPADTIGGPLKIHGYTADITVTATTHDFSKLGAMMEAGGDAGATSFSSAFRRADLPALKKKVREMALEAAKDKAMQNASALGLKLGRITAVVEAPAGQMWNNMYFSRSAVANQMMNAPAAPSGASLGGTSEALTLDISVTYELPISG